MAYLFLSGQQKIVSAMEHSKWGCVRPDKLCLGCSDGDVVTLRAQQMLKSSAISLCVQCGKGGPHASCAARRTWLNPVVLLLHLLPPHPLEARHVQGCFGQICFPSVCILIFIYELPTCLSPCRQAGGKWVSTALSAAGLCRAVFISALECTVSRRQFITYLLSQLTF